jgi:hypothetical protein
LAKSKRWFWVGNQTAGNFSQAHEGHVAPNHALLCWDQSTFEKKLLFKAFGLLKPFYNNNLKQNEGQVLSVDFYVSKKPRRYLTLL